MGTPDFIVELRTKIGHDPLWLPGVTGVIFDRHPAPERVLLVQRADNGRWALITGILDPGEDPAEGLLRECLEETGVRAELGPLFAVDSTGQQTFPNGDVCSFLNITFRGTALSGEARVNDDESLAVAWCALDDLPESLTPRHRRLIESAAVFTGAGAEFSGRTVS
jgi:ADP-ribose pyrophosphatase YjhB (NUDIX family)